MAKVSDRRVWDMSQDEIQTEWLALEYEQNCGEWSKTDRAKMTARQIQLERAMLPTEASVDSRSAK